MIQHLDSLIQIGLGAIFTWMGFRPTKTRVTTIFRVCGPALIVIGGLLLLRPAPTLEWRRQLTSDQVASAEFPGTPTPEEHTDTLGEITVKRTSFSYNVPGKDISLILSYSTLPDAAKAMTEAQRIESTLALFAQQGATIVKSEQDGSIHRFTLRQETKKASLQMALAYIGDNVYRVVATWMDGNEDRELTDRFVRSFRVSSH